MNNFDGMYGMYFCLIFLNSAVCLYRVCSVAVSFAVDFAVTGQFKSFDFDAVKPACYVDAVCHYSGAVFFLAYVSFPLAEEISTME